MEVPPRARAEGLSAQALDDGLVIYDSATHQGHSLNETASRIWSLADGTRTARQIAATAGVDEPLVLDALEQLGRLGLLHRSPGVSRRSMLRRAAGIGAGALAAAPVIETLVIPVAAAHASVGPPQPPQPPATPHVEVDPHHPGRPLILEEPTIVESAGPPHPLKKKKKKKKKKQKQHTQPQHHPGKPLTHHRPHHKPKPKPKPKWKPRPPDEPEAPGTI
jgi:Coenzyme PQQ synthesis protein D (PqqD)